MRLVVYLCLALALSVCTALASDIKEGPESLTHYIVGVYSEDLGDLDRAMQEYKKALETDPESPLLHLSLASIFIKKNDAVQAISQLKSAIKFAPDAVEPHAILALVYAAQNETEAASREYTLALKNAVKREPKNIEVYKSLGAVYLQQKKLREAESIFKLIAGLSPLDPAVHLYLGSIYSDLKDYPSVEKELRTALKLKSDYPEALNFLGYFYLEQNRNIDEAGKLIRKALASDPQNGAYIDSLGWFYFKKGRLKEALTELEKAAALMSDPVIYAHLGDVFLKSGNRESAKLNWEKSLKLDPAQEEIKTKLLKLTVNGK